MKKFFYSTVIVFMTITTSFFLKAHAAEGVIPLKLEFKGQKESVTPWGELSSESFLSYRKWREESDLQLQFPGWENIMHERSHHEMVGRVYQCIGTCRVDRGEGFFNGTYRSGLYEGDEIQTIGDSYAWIFLFDGTMVRLSPRSSVTFNEFNVGVKENFINARVNVGDVLWVSRQESQFEENNIRETDIIFFPYSEYESLPITEKNQYVEDDLMELLSETKTQLNHYKALNEKIQSNNKLTKKKPTYAFLVMPNATVMGLSPTVEMVSLIGGRSYFKKRSPANLGLVTEADAVSNELFLQLRGYDNKTLTPVQDDLWMGIDEKGRTSAETAELPLLNVSEFITKRIPSIMHGREIFLKRYSEFAFREKYDAKALAKDEGYRLWGELHSLDENNKSDLELRLEFLKEYFRRVETSNLLASTHLRERLESRGEKGMVTQFGDYFFITALNRYYKYGEGLRKNSNDIELGEVLNSTKKLLWKKMHGIR